MKKKKINREKLTKILVYVFCFALVGLSLFSLFSVFVGATDSESDTDISVVANCDHYYEYERSLPELQGTHADVYICAYCGDTYYEYAIPCEYAVSSVDGVIDGYCLSCSQKCDHQWKDGHCPVCTFPCPHKNHTIDGTCTYCGMVGGAHIIRDVVHEPNGSDVYHTTKKYCDCGYVETNFEAEHTYSNGKCSDCGYQCTHIFADSVCICCGYTCSHSSTTRYFESSDSDKHIELLVCDTCGTYTSETLFYHTIGSDGICTKCGYGCSHSDTYIDYHNIGDKSNHQRIEKCTYCGISFDVSLQAHIIDKNGICSRCNYICRHNNVVLRYEAPVIKEGTPVEYYHRIKVLCGDCGIDLTSHSQYNAWEKCKYVNGVCSICSYRCTHQRGFENGTCLRCGWTCKHDKGFNSSAKCFTCGFACSHPSTHYQVIYSTNPKAHPIQFHCDICGLMYKTSTQIHTFKDGKCTACGYLCTHSNTVDEVCTYCGYNCEHLKYTNGICDLCGRVCSHKWHNSTCKTCNMVCADHTFTNGSLRCDLCDSYVVIEGYQQNDGFFRLMSSIYDAQANTFLALTDYNILGVNIAQLIVSIICLVIAIIVLKKVI